MSQAPVYKHELQDSLFALAQKKYSITEKSLAGIMVDGAISKDVDGLRFIAPHHHTLVLVASLNELLGNRKETQTKDLQMKFAVDGFERVRFSLVDKGYTVLKAGMIVEERSVEMSALVYPEEISSIKGMKKTEKEIKETLGEDEPKAKPEMHRTAAHFAVVFFRDTKGQTRHYQEEAPMRIYPGMTMRPMANLIEDIAKFLIDGTPSPEAQF